MTETSLFYIDDLRAMPRIEEVYRLLGGRAEDAPERLRPLVDEAMILGRKLAKPRALYGFFDHIETDVALKNEPWPIILCVCTIGSTLEERVRELIRDSRIALATALDAVGSETVESLAEQLETLICKNFSTPERFVGQRFSPGYGNWPLDIGQQTIFSYLPADRIGVRLSPTFLMNPLKSISFAIKLSARTSAETSASKCSNCDKEDCPYRR